MVMKPMIQSIKSAHLSLQTLKVELATSHTCEYLSQNKEEISKEMSQYLNKNIQLIFEHNQNQCGEEINNNTEIMKDPAQTQNNDQSGLVQTVADLFDGKII
jgi:hypothetical protein